MAPVSPDVNPEPAEPLVDLSGFGSSDGPDGGNFGTVGLTVLLAFRMRTRRGAMVLEDCSKPFACAVVE